MDRPHYPEGDQNQCVSCNEPFPCALWHRKHPLTGPDCPACQRIVKGCHHTTEGCLLVEVSHG